MNRAKSIIFAMAIGVSAAAALADSVSYTTPSFGPLAAGTPLAPQLKQFDPSLGTLTGATVTLDITITPILSVFSLNQTNKSFTNGWTGTNTADAPTPPNPTTDLPFTVTDPYNAGNFGGTEYSWTTSGIAAPFTQTNFTDPNPVTMNTPVVNVPGADLSLYTGTGQYTLTYTTSNAESVQGSGAGLFFSPNWNISGKATVTYSYTVPLPASATSGLALIGALGAIGITKRRSRCLQG